jgi:hypothetical protein
MLMRIIPNPIASILQLHRGYLNGLKVAVKQLRAGTSDLDVAEQLLLEEAALMQVRSHIHLARTQIVYAVVSAPQPLCNIARVWMRARGGTAGANGDGALRWRVVV